MAFTRKEVNLFHDPYFTVIRETDDFFEVMSMNTGHCWNIFKNTIEYGTKVVLYHKQKFSDPYYHQHRIVRTVADAVQQIKEHDEYVLVKSQETAESKKIGERRLKVYETGGHDRTVPQIRLQGEWLRECGFEPGRHMRVTCEAGRIVIQTE